MYPKKKKTYQHPLNGLKFSNYNLIRTIYCYLNAGKCIPVIRGGGVYQQAVDLCIEKLACGDWVHVFPEGKVNMTKEHLRFKWGIGRMIYESPVLPIIVPIWHEGMDTVLPNYPPYIIKFGKRITINIGQPINLNELVTSLKSNNTPEPVARKIITDRLQEEMTVSFPHIFLLNIKQNKKFDVILAFGRNLHII